MRLLVSEVSEGVDPAYGSLIRINVSNANPPNFSIQTNKKRLSRDVTYLAHYLRRIGIPQSGYSLVNGETLSDLNSDLSIEAPKVSPEVYAALDAGLKQNLAVFDELENKHPSSWLETICTKALNGTCKGLGNEIIFSPRDEMFFNTLCSQSKSAYVVCPNGGDI